MFAGVWEPLLGSQLDARTFHKTFSDGGYYTIPLPGLKGHRLVVLNSVLFSVNYDNACGQNLQTPALDQLRWLSRALEKAQATGESVWLLMHVPPGINSFNSAQDVLKGGSPVTFWQRELTSQFLQLVRRYRSTFQVAFAGHTHMDDFRVIRLEGKSMLLCKIVPAISPIFRNYPGYQVYQHDRGTGALQNYQTYYLANLADAPQPLTPPDGRWAFEYDFRDAYGYPELSTHTVARLSNTLKANATARERYTKYFSVSAAPEFTERTFAVYRCAITNITPAEFLMCLSGVPKPKVSLPYPDRKRSLQSVAHP